MHVVYQERKFVSVLLIVCVGVRMCEREAESVFWHVHAQMEVCVLEH